jgi:hypothetical protein
MSKLTAYFYVRDRVLPNINCTAQDAAVLLMLAGYANPDGTKIYQSFGSLAKSTKLSPRSVVRSIAYWIHTGLLVRVKQGGGRGSANEYRVVLLERAALDDLIARINCVSQSQFGRPKLCPPRPETMSPTTINCAPAWHTTVKSLPENLNRPPLPPVNGGNVPAGLSHDDLLKDETNYALIGWGGQIIIVRTGRHKRILTKNEASAFVGSTTERMVEHLRSKGFWAEVYTRAVGASRKTQT